MSPLRAVPAIARKLRQWAFAFLSRNWRRTIVGLALLSLVEVAARAYVLRRIDREAQGRGLTVSVGACLVGPLGISLSDINVSGPLVRGHFSSVRVEWFPKKEVFVRDGTAAVSRPEPKPGDEGSRDGNSSTNFTIRAVRIAVDFESGDNRGRCDGGGATLERGQISWSCTEFSAVAGKITIGARRVMGTRGNRRADVSAQHVRVILSERQVEKGDLPPVDRQTHDLKGTFALVRSNRDRALAVLRRLAESGRVRIDDAFIGEVGVGSVAAEWGSPGGQAPAASAQVAFVEGNVEAQFADFPIGRLLPKLPGWCSPEAARVSGKVRVSGDENIVSGTIDARGLCVEHARIADGPLQLQPLAINFHVAPSHDEKWRVFGSVAHGEAKVVADMVVLPRPTNPSIQLELRIPEVRCQLAFEAMPAGSWSRLGGTELTGTFALDAKLSLEVGSKEDPKLDYTISDLCRFVRVPQDIARDIFRKPFPHRFYGPDGAEVVRLAGPGTPEWTAYGRVGKFLPLAVTAMEDGTFFRHRGFHHPSLKSALIADLRAGAFLRGGSTVTMQLAKNMFLTRHKTLFRKIEEVILTDYLEQTFGKDELLELYLNLIEFGPNVYGVRAAAQYYFSTSPSDLTLGEALFLISVLPSPVKHARMRGNGSVPEGWSRYLRRAAENLKRAGGLEPEDIEEAFREPIYFGGRRKAPTPSSAEDTAP